MLKGRRESGQGPGKWLEQSKQPQEAGRTGERERGGGEKALTISNASNKHFSAADLLEAFSSERLELLRA